MSDRMLADFLAIEEPVTISMHIRSIDQNKAIKIAKRKLSDVDKMKMEQQKKTSMAGYDPDILPPDIKTFSDEAKALLDDLQSRNERYFLMTFLIMNVADTKKQLENVIFREKGIAQKYNCQLKRLDFQQEDGLFTCASLGNNLIKINRGLTTTATAIFIPFTTQELFQDGESLYYGVNTLSNNMIMCDRKLLKNPNGIFLGTPGSGKSFLAKREITNVYFVTDDDIIICDPEAEYYPLVEELNGQEVYNLRCMVFIGVT
jgi:type IV secretory pathway VirB4 component